MIHGYGDRVLVRIVEIEKKKSLLIVPDEKKEFQIGIVIGGDGENLIDGDYVWTRKYAGLLVEYDGIEYVSLDQKEILAYSKELK